MINKILIAFFVLVLLGIGFILFNMQFSKHEIASPEEFIPKRSAIVFKANGINPLLALMDENSFLSNPVSNKNDISKWHQILDSLSSEKEEISTILNDKNFWIALLPGDNENGIICIVPINAELKKSELEEIITPLKSSLNINLYEYISGAGNDQSRNSWYYLIKDGLLFLANQPELIHEAIISKESELSAKSDSSFVKVYGTSGANAAATIYLNFQTIRDFLRIYSNRNNSKRVFKLFSKEGWAALDVNFTRENIVLQGFNYSVPSQFMLSNLLRNEQASENNFINRIIPDNAIFVGSCAVNDAYNFNVYRNEFLQKNKSFSNKVAEIRKNIGFEADSEIMNKLGNLAAFMVCEDKNEYKSFFVLQMAKEEQASQFLKSLKNSRFSLVGEDSVYAVKFNSGKIPYALAGDIFEDFDFSYGCSFRQFLIFGESENDLKNLVYKIQSGQLLLNDSLFQKVANELILSKSNLNYFINPLKSLNLFSEYLNDSSLRIFKSNFKNSKSFIGAQFSGNGEFIYSNIFVHVERNDSVPLELEWQLDADTSMLFMQQVFNQSQNMSFFVQDADFNIMLVSSYGSVLWKKPLNFPILGNVHEIDYYKNGKFQLLFNTQDQLYLIDKNGNEVEDFPIKFKNKASNGLEVADFDKDRNYRYYLAFENRSFLVLDKEGRKIEGWKFSKSASEVNASAIVFTFKEKDYISFYDSNQVYLLNRKGESKFSKSHSVRTSENASLFVEKKANYFRLVINDKNSILHFLYPDDREELAGPFHLYENAIFTIAGNAYIMADSTKMVAIDNSFQSIFTLPLDEPVHGKLVIHKTTKANHILYANKTQKKINLLLENGMPLKASPIFGDYPFIFISLYNGMGSRLICSSGNQLLFYSIPE